jgi:hypothetical protein
MTSLKCKATQCFLIVALGLLSVNVSYAQHAEIGFRYMPTFSSSSFQTAAGGSIKGEVTLGYGVGGFLAFNFNNHVGLQAEVIYNSISQKYKESDFERKINLKYFNIPLLLSINTGKDKVVNFNIVAGPQLGLSVGSSITNPGNTGIDSVRAVLAVKKGDLGLAYGAGLDFALNAAHTFRLGIGYRGVVGLFDISDNSATLSNKSYFILGKTHINTNSVYAGLSFIF